MGTRNLNLYPRVDGNYRGESAAVAVSYPDILDLCYLHCTRLPEALHTVRRIPSSIGEDLPGRHYGMIVLGDLTPWTYRRLKQMLAQGGKPVIVRPHLYPEEHLLLADLFGDDPEYCAWLADPAMPGLATLVIHFHNALRIRGKRVRLADDDMSRLPLHGVYYASDERRLRWRQTALRFSYDVTEGTSPTLWLHVTTNTEGETPDPMRDTLLLGSRRVCSDNLRLLLRRFPERVLVEDIGAFAMIMGSNSIFVPLGRTEYFKRPPPKEPESLRTFLARGGTFASIGKRPLAVTTMYLLTNDAAHCLKATEGD